MRDAVLLQGGAITDKFAAMTSIAQRQSASQHPPQRHNEGGTHSQHIDSVLWLALQSFQLCLGILDVCLHTISQVTRTPLLRAPTSSANHPASTYRAGRADGGPKALRQGGCLIHGASWAGYCHRGVLDMQRAQDTAVSL